MQEIILAIAVVNIFTFIAYAYDKSMSRKGGWRVPEKNLHLLAIIGGSPAAIMASKILRHKNRKTSFQLVLWLIFLIQLMLVAAYITNPELF